MIMLPNGELTGRCIQASGSREPLETIMIVGDDLRIFYDTDATISEFTRRHAQAFGKGTTVLLRGLRIAIIGCSGTGSIVAEQLARLGVGYLVLIDPDRVEVKNLNRILNATMEHAVMQDYKVHVLGRAIARMGLGTIVTPLPINLANPDAIHAAAACDLVIGCMDGVEGRDLLNRIATFYTLPYFDVGVKLEADGRGGIENITGTVHYLQPGRSSLHSRGVYTMEDVRAEGLRRTNPEMYTENLNAGYLRGVQEDRPAVISVNMTFAALLVNDLLSRVHPYRNEPNRAYATVRASLAELQFHCEPEEGQCALLARHVGRGDVIPLLERPALS
jgi:hypothetical protein